jgi:hypothetical protein
MMTYPSSATWRPFWDLLGAIMTANSQSGLIDVLVTASRTLCKNSLASKSSQLPLVFSSGWIMDAEAAVTWHRLCFSLEQRSLSVPS